MNANSLPFLRRPAARAAGQAVPVGIEITPTQWFSWFAAQRDGYVRSQFRPLPGESSADYDRRVKSISAQITTQMWAAHRPAAGALYRIRPAQGSLPGSSDPSNYGIGDQPTGVDNSGGGGGMSSQDIATIANTAAAVIGTAGTTIAAIIRSGSDLQRQQMQNDLQIQLATLANQRAASNDPAAITAANAQIASLQNVVTALRAGATPRQAPPDEGMSTNMMIALGVGAVAILGIGAYMLTRPRRNPVIYTRRQTKSEKLLHKRGKIRPTRFVPARKIK